MAVPQSGPMTNRPCSRAYVFSATSSSIGTLSLNSMTFKPSRSALRPRPRRTRPASRSARSWPRARAPAPSAGSPAASCAGRRPAMRCGRLANRRFRGRERGFERARLAAPLTTTRRSLVPASGSPSSNPGLAQHVEVGRRRHVADACSTPGRSRKRRRQLHHRHGIAIQVADHSVCGGIAPLGDFGRRRLGSGGVQLLVHQLVYK